MNTAKPTRPGTWFEAGKENMWPQIILIVLIGINFGRSASKHGESECDTENAWITLFAAIVLVLLLAWGGFWSPLFN